MEHETRDRLQAVLGDAYSIERELGGGGMSRLFLAVERSLGRRVVVKLLPPEWASEVSAQRFQREITLTANLPHPHILPILAAGSRDGHLYYITPYLPGESLGQRLQSGPLPLNEALRFLGEITDALAFAHSHGVVHRDVKPANVLLQDGHAVLADFGVARALAVSTTGDAVTRTGLTVGTPGYMAPEQLAGDADVGARADVYALSVLAYEMLAGKPPFAGTDATRLAAAHLSETPRSLAELCPGAPASVADVVMRGLAKSPAGRPASATEFRQALALNVSSRPRPTRRRIIGATTALLVVVVLGVFLAQRSTSPASDPAKLVIAPIAVMDPALGEWRMGIVDWLSRTLDGAGDLRTVPASAIAARTRSQSDIGAMAIARQLGAGLAVDGSLIRAGRDSVRLALTVRDPSSEQVLAEVSVKDAEANFDRLMDSATVQVLQGLGRSRRIGPSRYASLGSRSLPAIKAFLRGEEQYRRLDLTNARRSYEEAVQLDSVFAPALRKLGHVYRYLGTMGGASALLERAARYNRRLGARDSLLVLVDSVQAVVGRRPYSSNVRRLLGIVEELTRRYEDDAEAWVLYANLHYWSGFAAWNPPVVFSSAHRRDLYERGIAADSLNVDALLSSASESILLGDSAAARVRFVQCLQAAPPGYGNTACAMLLALLERPDDDRTLALLDTAPEWVRVNLSTFDDLADARESAVWASRRFASHPTQDRSFDVTSLMISLAARGHLAEAWKLGSVNRADNVMGQIAALGGVRPEIANQFFRRAYVGLTERVKSGGPLWWYVESRDTTILRRLVRGAAPAGRGVTDNDRLLAAYVRQMAAAHLALERADTNAAIQTLSAVPDSACGRCVQLRFSTARLLSARGQFREAAASLSQTALAGNIGPIAVLWRLERARVSERLGDNAQAIDDYAYVAGMWQNADAVLQPYVAESRRALARLGSDRARQVTREATRSRP